MNRSAAELDKNDLNFGIYFTSGKEDFWLRHTEKVFCSLVPEDSFSLHRFEKISSFDDVLNAAVTVGFSDDPNVVIVKDSDYKASEDDKRRLTEFSCTDAYILFVNAKFFSTEKKSGKKGGRESKKPSAAFTAEEKRAFNEIVCEKSDKLSCARYVERLFPFGIEKRAAIMLAEYTDCDMARMSLEAKKLTDYCGEGVVKEADVAELVVEDADSEVYSFVNSIIDGKNEQARYLLGKLRKRGESPSLILASLVSQYRRMLYAGISPLPDGELADLFKVKEFAITKARNNRKISKKQLKGTLDMLVSYEMKFKNGLMSEQTAFESAIAKLMAKEII